MKSLGLAMTLALLATGSAAHAGSIIDTIIGASTTSYEITGLASGTWYFAVAPLAADGTESSMSNVGSKIIY